MDTETRAPETREFLPAEAITRALVDDMNRLEAAARRLDAARRAHAHMLATYGGDGPTAAAVRAEQDAALEGAEDEIAAVAQSAFASARRILDQYERAAGVALSGEDAQRAAAIRDEVKDDVELLNAPALRDRMVAALTANDRAAMHLLARHVPTRSFDFPDGSPGEAQAIREINALVGKMRDALRDARYDSDIAVTHKVLGQASDLLTNASRRRTRREADEAVARFFPNGRGVPLPEEGQGDG